MSLNFQLVSGGSSGTQQTDEENHDASSDTDVGKGDGYTEGIPGPVTRLFVLANRGLANLVQDLILVSFEKLVCQVSVFDVYCYFISENRSNQRACCELQGTINHGSHLNNSTETLKTWSCSLSSTFFPQLKL